MQPGEGHLPSISDYHTISGRGQRLSAQAFLYPHTQKASSSMYSSVRPSLARLFLWKLPSTLNSCAGSACGTTTVRYGRARPGIDTASEPPPLPLLLLSFLISHGVRSKLTRLSVGRLSSILCSTSLLHSLKSSWIEISELNARSPAHLPCPKSNCAPEGNRHDKKLVRFSQRGLLSRSSSS